MDSSSGERSPRALPISLLLTWKVPEQNSGEGILPGTSGEGQTGRHGNFRNISTTPMGRGLAPLGRAPNPMEWGEDVEQPAGGRPRCSGSTGGTWSKADTCRESWAGAGRKKQFQCLKNQHRKYFYPFSFKIEPLWDLLTFCHQHLRYLVAIIVLPPVAPWKTRA